MDQILIDPAVEAGAHLRTGLAVQEYIGDGERITGIRGREAAGRTLVTAHALDDAYTGLRPLDEARGNPAETRRYFLRMQGVEEPQRELS